MTHGFALLFDIDYRLCAGIIYRNCQPHTHCAREAQGNWRDGAYPEKEGLHFLFKRGRILNAHSDY
jgi:hypothetical protein